MRKPAKTFAMACGGLVVDGGRRLRRGGGIRLRAEIRQKCLLVPKGDAPLWSYWY